MNEKPNKKKTWYLIFTLLAVGVLITACSGDTESGLSLKEWVSQPITELSVFDLFLVMFFVGIITK